METVRLKKHVKRKGCESIFGSFPNSCLDLLLINANNSNEGLRPVTETQHATMNYPAGGFATGTDRVLVTGPAVNSAEAQCHGSIWTEIKVVTLQSVKMGMVAKIRRSFPPI